MLVKAKDMPRIFASEQPTALAQHFHDVAVANSSTRKRYIQRSQRVLKGQIGHQSTDHPCHRPLPQAATQYGQQQLIAVVDLAFGINHDQAIRIADSGYVIVHGKIAFSGKSADELHNNDLIRKLYLGI